MSNITLKELGEILGLSTGTVSKALKDYYDISPETKRRVKELAKELNYVPNSLAVTFRTRETKTIGLIIPEVVHHFFSNVVKGIVEEAEKHNYLVIILQSNESYKLEKKYIELLAGKRVDGILISLSNKTVRFNHLEKIINNGIPIVLFDKIAKEINCSKVLIDDKKAAYEATEHLIKRGRKRIVYIRGPLIPQNAIDRFLGYKKALEDYRIAYDSKLVYTCEDVTFEEGYDFANEILKDHKDVDGIFATTDLVASGVITRLNELEKNIPEEIAVMGFSNWMMSKALMPPLSTIQQPSFKMGKEAFNLLLKEINNKKQGREVVFETLKLPTSIIKRKSS